MDGELSSLASSAATTMVNLLATDAWVQVKERVGGLFRQYRPDQAQAAEAELDLGHQEIGTADATIALALARDWESRLLRLMAADAAAVDSVRRVAGELSQLVVGQQVAQTVWQSASASGQSTLIQAGRDATVGKLPLMLHEPSTEHGPSAEDRPSSDYWPEGAERASMRAEPSGQARAYQAGNNQYIGHVHLNSLGSGNQELSGELSLPVRIDLVRDWDILAVGITSIATLIVLLMPWISLSVSSDGISVTGGVFAQGLTPPFAIIAILAGTGAVITTCIWLAARIARKAIGYTAAGLALTAALFILIEVLYVNEAAASTNSIIKSMNKDNPGHGSGHDGAHLLITGWIDLLLALIAAGLAITGLIRQRRKWHQPETSS